MPMPVSGIVSQPQLRDGDANVLSLDRNGCLRTDAGEILKKLLWLLPLSAGERQFVQSLANNPGDECTLKVFADWLKEQGRDEDAATMLAVKGGNP